MVVLVCATLMYITFGVLLYLAFGPDTGFSTGQVTENLEQFASHMPDTNFWHSVQVLVKLRLIIVIAIIYMHNAYNIIFYYQSPKIG